MTTVSGKNHSYFFGDSVVYTNSKTTTEITRVPILAEPSVKADTPPDYSSRQEMLEQELRKRTARPILPKIKHICYSDIPRADMKVKVTLSEDLLGLDKNRELNFTNEYFHHSELNGKTYTHEGKVHQVHHAIASSWDRSTSHLMMARVLYDENGSIFYGGRPDSKESATQQGIDIFLKERKLGRAIPQENGIYQLTYVVNSLTNGGTLQRPDSLNERESLVNERRALNQVKGELVTIEGCQVRLNPIHVHHMLSFWTRFAAVLPDDVSGLKIEREINSTGYAALIAHAKTLPSERINQIIAILEMEESKNLPVHERLLLIDLLAKLCDLPVVHHCKSVVDRTSIAAGISTINHLLVHNQIPKQIPWPKEGPHLLCHGEEYKHLFLATLNIQHQVSKDARTGLRPDGTIEDDGREQLGLNYHADTFGTVPSALKLLPNPDETLKDTWFQGYTKRVVTLLGAITAIVSVISGIYHLAVIGFTVYAYRKTGKWQGQFLWEMAKLPFRVKWLRLGEIDASKIFNFDSLEINGDERALLIGAKTTHMQAQEDPRYQAMPKHLRRRGRCSHNSDQEFEESTETESLAESSVTSDTQSEGCTVTEEELEPPIPQDQDLTTAPTNDAWTQSQYVTAAKVAKLPIESVCGCGHFFIPYDPYFYFEQAFPYPTASCIERLSNNLLAIPSYTPQAAYPLLLGYDPSLNTPPPAQQTTPIAPPARQASSLPTARLIDALDLPTSARKRSPTPLSHLDLATSRYPVIKEWCFPTPRHTIKNLPIPVIGRNNLTVDEFAPCYEEEGEPDQPSATSFQSSPPLTQRAINVETSQADLYDDSTLLPSWLFNSLEDAAPPPLPAEPSPSAMPTEPSPSAMQPLELEDAAPPPLPAEPSPSAMPTEPSPSAMPTEPSPSAMQPLEIESNPAGRRFCFIQ